MEQISGEAGRRTIRVALIQMSTEYEVEKNVQKAENLIRSAAADGAKIICLQEIFNTIYFCYEIDQRHRSLAETIPGATIRRMQEVAKDERVALVAPIYEKVMEGLFFNSAAVIAPDGGLLGVYRKSSIPLGVETSMKAYEKYYFAEGDTGYRTFDTPFGVRIGVAICYERHFPETVRCLALQGADVVLIPTATTGFTRPMWELELRAHALFNLLYVGGVNRVGVDEGGETKSWYGSSLWANPRGEIIAQAGDTSDEVLMADLDLSLISEMRDKLGFFRDRRPDLYGQITASAHVV